MTKEQLSLESTDFAHGLLSEAQVDSVRKLLISKKQVSKEEHYPSFLINVFPSLINTLKNASDSGKIRIFCTDTLSIWILRVDQLSRKDAEFHTKVSSEVLTADTLDFLYKFIIDYWDETGAPLANSLKDLFNKLIILQKSYESNELFENWIAQALQIKPERRVRYYLIETLVKEVEDSHYIIKKEPDFISNTMYLISSNSLGNPVGKALSSLYKRLYTNEDEATNWVNSYWAPVIKGLRDPKLSKGVEQHLLPNLFKLSPTAFKLAVKEIKDDVELFITCLNIGQQLAIEDETISEVLTVDMVESLIVKDDFKVKAFQLLTYSHKGSKQIPETTLTILKKTLPVFFVGVEVEPRNEFISLFKQFLYRLKDSSYALNRDAEKLLKSKYADQAVSKYEAIDLYKNFLVWIITFLKTQLRPGSTYQRIITSLKIFRQLLESNLDPRTSFEVQIKYSFNLPVFDEELIDLLLGNLLSTYDDIRDESHFLLLHSSIDTSKSQSIIDLGFEMLDDYGSSDSGAKLLQLAHTLFKDSSVFDLLISKIPLIEVISEAVKKPIDGYFNAIHLILKNLKILPNQDTAAELISIIEKSWDIVKEILTNDSPEGCDQYGVGSAQLVLSYGWRSTKESTLVIQELLNHKISDELLLRVGELTIDQLSTVRHRGAFSSVYPTFVKVLSVCHRQLPEQAKKWLDQTISLIQTKTQLITRRSGGLPFLITAIVTVENEFFKYSFDQLLEIAKIPISEKEESEKMDLPQIHAFNCIKTMFIETQLSSLCGPFVYEALELSFSSFSSNIWSVRNCSIMLFTALQNRLFGRKRMSAAVFFTRYKGLREILINILKNIDDKNLEILFPVLTILSKLEASPGYEGLNDFVPLLRSCLSVKYWKIRECAARALASLVSNQTEEALWLLKSCSIKNQNQLHGYLLAIKELSSTDSTLSTILESKIGEFLVANPSYVTAKVYLEISLKSSGLKNSNIQSVLLETFTKEIKDLEVDGSKQLFLKALFDCLEKSNTVLEAALTSSYFELQLSAIDYCAESNTRTPTLSTVVQNKELLPYVRARAIKLVEEISIEEAIEYSKNQDKYGEDLRCSAFEFLGGAVSNLGEFYNEWISSLKESSSDDEPFPIRIAALRSALRYLRCNKTSEVLWIVYKFLSDDDDEIRDLASSYFEPGVVPLISAQRFINSYKGDISPAVEDIDSFKPSFASLQNVKGLFSIEKKNFYRNNIEQSLQLTQIVDKSSVDINRLTNVKEELIDFLKTTKLRLDWSIDEILFENIYISLLFLKSFDIDLGELQHLATQDKIHPTIRSLVI